MKKIVIIMIILSLNFLLIAGDKKDIDSKVDSAFDELSIEEENYNKKKTYKETEDELEEVTKEAHEEINKTKDSEDINITEDSGSTTIESDENEVKKEVILKELEIIVKKRYSKFQIDASYNSVKIPISISEFQTKISKDKSAILLFGYLSPELKCDYTLYNFSDNQLTDIWFFMDKDNKKSNYSLIKKSLEKYLGSGNRIDKNRETWRGKKNSLLLYRSMVIEEKEYSILHYFNNESYEELGTISNYFAEYNDLQNHKGNSDFSIGISFDCSIVDTKFYNFKYKNSDNTIKYDDISGHLLLCSFAPVSIPISFSYFVTNNNAVGLTFVAAYSLLQSYTSKNLNDLDLHRVSFKMMFRDKYGKPERKSKFVFEFGLKGVMDIFYDKTDKAFTFESSAGYTIYGPKSFIGGGFTLHLGWTRDNKNSSFSSSFFTDVTFGKASYDYINFEPESLNVDVAFGIDIRLSYYKLYEKK